jgi:NADH:ubiquinone oxidoreductase subunit 2 (subunit N)
MLEPVSAAQSLRWLWPELGLLVGWLLVRVLESAPDVSYLSPRRFAPLATLVALVASFGIPFEPAALAGDLLRSDPPAVLAIRIILATTTLALLLGGAVELIPVALAGCLAARAGDAVMMTGALLFLSLTSVLAALRSGGPTAVRRDDLVGPALEAALAAAGAALLLGATGQTAFGPLGVGLDHHERIDGWLFLAALAPVAVVAHRIAAAPRAARRAAPDDALDTTTAAILLVTVTGLVVLLARWTGVVLGGDTGTAATGSAAALPWKPVIAFVALVAVIRGTVTALGADRTGPLAAGLVEGQVGWILAGLAAGPMGGAAAALVALITLVPALLAVAARPRPGNAADAALRARPDAPARRLDTGGLAVAVILLTMAAAPGTAGFVGRWELLHATRQGASWWLVLPGVLAWTLGLVAVLRWGLDPSLRRDVIVTRPGILLALLLLAGALAGPPLRALVGDVLPFP